MILVDTYAWVKHLRSGEPALARRLDAGEVLSHLFVTGELALGISYVDAHLLASARLSPDARLWTRDRRLRDLAARLDLAPIAP
jgi:hypothetical protein